MGLLIYILICMYNICEYVLNVKNVMLCYGMFFCILIFLVNKIIDLNNIII